MNSNQRINRPGRFYGVGIGPGDPELLTLKAHRILTMVPVVFTPVTARERDSMAGNIINGLVAGPGQELVELVFPMVRDRQKLEASWQEAADTVWQCLAAGKDCAFINLGDPLLYGTFVHLLSALQQAHPDIDVEIVPGISSVLAAAAAGPVPLALEGGNLAVISLPAEESYIRQVLEQFETVVFMKVSRNMAVITHILENMGVTEKCLYVRRVTTDKEEIVRDFQQLKEQEPDYFSLLIVRK